MKTPSSYKEKVIQRIADKEREIVQLCADITRVPSANPPGDTTGVVAILEPYLREYGFETEILRKRPEMPNLIATPARSAAGGAHVILNGHLDVFPVDPTEAWDFEPFGGEVRDGKILGRGTADMKGGVVASIAAATTIAELGIELPGRMMLTLVSDEEMGSRNGVAWLLKEYPDLRGDVCISGEPTGPGVVFYGERGVNDWIIRASGTSGPGAAYLVGRNAIEILAAAIPVVKSLAGTRGEFPQDLQPYLEEARRVIDEEIVSGASRVLDMLTLNIGLISGGTNPAVTPVSAEMVVNFRVPLGITPYQAKEMLDRKLAETGLDKEVQCVFMHDDMGINDATYTSPTSKLVAGMKKNAEEVVGKAPRLGFGGGATDMRFYRRFGVPAVQHGPRSYPTFAAVPNEFIYVKDLLDVAKVHAGTILDYLSPD